MWIETQAGSSNSCEGSNFSSPAGASAASVRAFSEEVHRVDSCPKYVASETPSSSVYASA